MESIKVSVIIPVFNTAIYLFDALKSITDQTLSAIEIIAINDGSTDNSAAILAQYASIEPRLKIITFEHNKGVSMSRNAGIAAACGQYVYFFDSDDLLEKDCLEACYKKSVALNIDFLIFDGVSFQHDAFAHGPALHYNLTKHLNNEIYTGTELLDELNATKSYSCSVCLCFINRAYLSRTRLLFYPGILYEDVLFSLQLYMLAHSVSYIPLPYFRRRMRPNSTMTSQISQKTVNYRFVVCHELIAAKAKFTDSRNRKQINLQVRNMMNFLLKNIVKSKNMQLFVRNIFKIIGFYAKTL